MEIQRLIGRALRSVIDLRLVGERTILLDCDVIQADGGTRTAAITGSFVAMVDALAQLRTSGLIEQMPVKDYLAAISVGIVDGVPMLDLAYIEDSRAEVDLNLVMTGRGQVVEVQGTGEGGPFSRSQLEQLLDLASSGIEQLIAMQRTALGDVGIEEMHTHVCEAVGARQ